jgi:hypothetical protein
MVSRQLALGDVDVTKETLLRGDQETISFFALPALTRHAIPQHSLT